MLHLEYKTWAHKKRVRNKTLIRRKRYRRYIPHGNRFKNFDETIRLPNNGISDSVTNNYRYRTSQNNSIG